MNSELADRLLIARLELDPNAMEYALFIGKLITIFICDVQR